MKVLLINAVCGIGSTGRIVADIWEALKAEGHEAKVAFGVGKGNIVLPEDRIYFNNKLGYYIHNIMAKITDKTGLYSDFQTKRLLEVIDKYHPDIIHLHNLHGYYINYKILFDYLVKNNIPIVWTLHDCWAYTGHCVHYSANKCYKWEKRCMNCAYVNEYPTCWFKGNVKFNYDLKKKIFTKIERMVITTPSGWLADEVCKSFLSKYPIEVVHNGIDLSVFKPIPTNFKKEHGIENKIMILAVANVWSNRKGLDDLIKLSQYLDTKKVIVIVGLNKNQIANLPTNIIALQRTTSLERLVEIYSAADVFVNLSVEETFGMVTVEALACATPAVTYDQTAVPEVINNNSGVVVHAGDIYGVVNAIDKAVTMKREKIRERAELFSKGKEIEHFISIYKKMIDEELNI